MHNVNPSLATKTEQTAPATQAQGRLHLPESCFIAADHGVVQIMTPDGEVEQSPISEHHRLFTDEFKSAQPPILCNAPFLQRRLNRPDLAGFDILELYAFLFPIQETVPTLAGLSQCLNLQYDPTNPALALFSLTQHLLTLADTETRNDDKKRLQFITICKAMKGWGWQASLLAALGVSDEDIHKIVQSAPDANGLSIWKKLPEWSEHAPEPPAGHKAITADESEIRLRHWVEKRQGVIRHAQIEYTQNMSHAFQPCLEEGTPNIVMAEAGTGIGKTLGYLSPATLWADKNEGSVWISTFTKNLQKQIHHELDLHFSTPLEKEQNVVVRKGRENYLCLLNFEEMVAAVPTTNHRALPIVAGLFARWISESKDGDIRGGDFHGWLGTLIGEQTINRLADKRGECIHSACPHYHKCFIEKSVRKSRRAKIVIANHALVMIQNALAVTDKDDNKNSTVNALPTRYIFDEGHHLFEAADSAFACHLSGRETTDLKRWLKGASANMRGGRNASRRRGLKARMDYIPDEKGDYAQLVDQIIYAADILPDAGWRDRIIKGNPVQACEVFLAMVRAYILATAPKQDPFYSLECGKDSLPPSLLKAANILHDSLIDLKKPLMALIQRLEHDLQAKQEEWESDIRRRVETMIQSLKRRILHGLDGWISMLETIHIQQENLSQQSTPHHIQQNSLDWFELTRIEGQELDVGFYRHAIDPMQPFIKVIEPHIHGYGVTSATLSAGKDFRFDLSGLQHFEKPPSLKLFRATSPYDYPQRSKILVVNDLNINDLPQIATAYFNLFKAAQGGGLGIFTAIQRMKAVHEHIRPMMDQAQIPLYAQHLDGLSPASLIDIFRAEKDSCLLGTDALRDGVDIPGHSLRLMVFDRVPWPRPTLLHKARRNVFGGRDYDDDLTRMKLKQAFGRLIRGEKDKGVFVILDSRLPSRLTDAFPENMAIERIGIHQAIKTIADFITPETNEPQTRPSEI